MMSETRKQLVVWSGGVDSTLVLHNLAKVSTKDNPVIAVSFKTDFVNELKTKQEEVVRKSYLKYAKSKNYFIQHQIINVSSGLCPERLGWPQQLSWFCFLLPYIPNNCDVSYGYIQGDCCWLVVDKFYGMFKHFQYIGDRNETSLNFPLSFKTKREVLEEFKVAKIPLKYTWTCEYPIEKNGVMKPCKKCVPCVTLKMAKQEINYIKKHRVKEFRKDKY